MLDAGKPLVESPQFQIRDFAKGAPLSVGFYHKIELHGSKLAFLCVFERMTAHLSCYSASGSCCSSYVATVRHWTAAFLIWMQKVRADHLAIVICHEYVVPIAEPKPWNVRPGSNPAARRKFRRQSINGFIIDQIGSKSSVGVLHELLP